MRLNARAVFGSAHGLPTTVADFHRGDTKTSLLERTDIGCVLVTSAVDAANAASELRVAVALEYPLEAGATRKAKLHRVLWLTPRSWLMHCPVNEETALATRINQAFPDKRVHAALYTDQLTWLELSGSQPLRLLAAGGFVSLESDGVPLGHAKRTILAGIAIVIVHEDSDTWLLGVERSRAIYFVEWLRAEGKRHRRPAEGGASRDRE